MPQFFALPAPATGGRQRRLAAAATRAPARLRCATVERRATRPSTLRTNDRRQIQSQNLARRAFLLAGGALMLEACHTLAGARGTHALIQRPHPDAWQPVLRSLITTVLPFEHPAFPRVSEDALFDELNRLFPIERDPSFKTLPTALMLFDDCALFETPLPPFIDDERLDLARSRVPETERDAAIERAERHEREAWRAYAARFGARRFATQSLEAKRAYLTLWSQSELVMRRRFYRGAKALVTITAYSTRPFWDAVGYEGPLLKPG
jgi:hypothetical protein